MLAEEIKSRKEENTIYRLCNQARQSLMHEIKTPLSLITSPLKEMVNASSLPIIFQQKAKTAYRNAIGMQNICDLMLDIYERENEELILNVSSYPAMHVIYNAITASNELLNVAPINLHIHYLHRKYGDMRLKAHSVGCILLSCSLSIFLLLLGCFYHNVV